MSSEEKKKILQMVENGKITVEEAVTLLKVMEENPIEDEVKFDNTEAKTGSTYEAKEFDEVKARVRKYISIPLGIGVVMTVLAAYWMFTLTQNKNYGFWFFCAWFPLLFGILLVALTAGGFNSRWLYVDIQQGLGEWPERITFGFPVPFGLASWGIRNFGHYAKDIGQTQIEAIETALEISKSMDKPLILDVDEGDSGERVQIFIG